MATDSVDGILSKLRSHPRRLLKDPDKDKQRKELEYLPDGSHLAPQRVKVDSHIRFENRQDSDINNAVREARYIGSFAVQGETEEQRNEFVKGKLEHMKDTLQTKPVLLVISLSGIKVCSKTGESMLMAHALERISYARWEPESRQFSFLAREPKVLNNVQYCHAFLTATSLEAEELNTIVGNAFRMAYADQRRAQGGVGGGSTGSGDDISLGGESCSSNQDLSSGGVPGGELDSSGAQSEQGTPTAVNSQPTFQELIEQQLVEKRLREEERTREKETILRQRLHRISTANIEEQLAERHGRRHHSSGDRTGDSSTDNDSAGGDVAPTPEQQRMLNEKLNRISAPGVEGKLREVRERRARREEQSRIESVQKSPRKTTWAKQSAHKARHKEPFAELVSGGGGAAVNTAAATGVSGSNPGRVAGAGPALSKHLYDESGTPVESGGRGDSVRAGHSSLSELRGAVESGPYRGSPVTALKESIDYHFSGFNESHLKRLSSEPGSTNQNTSSNQNAAYSGLTNQNAAYNSLTNQNAAYSSSTNQNAAYNSALHPSASANERLGSSQLPSDFMRQTSVPNMASRPLPETPDERRQIPVHPVPYSGTRSGSPGQRGPHTPTHRTSAPGHPQHTAHRQRHVSSSPQRHPHSQQYTPSTYQHQHSRSRSGSRSRDGDVTSHVNHAGEPANSAGDESALEALWLAVNDVAVVGAGYNRAQQECQQQQSDECTNTYQGPATPIRYDSLRRLDPRELPVEDELKAASWYQPGIPREIALEILAQQEAGAFIIRDSTSHRGCYALSVRVPKFENPAGISHYLIHRTPRGVKLKGLDKEWPNLASLVTHHTVMKELLPCTLSMPRAAHNPTYTERDSELLMDYPLGGATEPSSTNAVTATYPATARDGTASYHRPRPLTTGTGTQSGTMTSLAGTGTDFSGMMQGMHI